MRIAALALFGSLSLGGCGAHAKYTVDDVALAQIPMSEKQSIFAAEQDVAVARAERVKAESDVDDAKHDLAVAEADREQARLEVDKAKLEQEAAEKSHDLNRQKAADRLREIADLGDRTAAAKVDMLAMKKKWRKEIVDVADERIRAAMAKLELEKAKLAASKNIRPTPEFNLATFSEEYAKRQMAVEEEKRDVEERKIDCDKLTRVWKELKEQYDRRKSSNASAAN